MAPPRCFGGVAAPKISLSCLSAPKFLKIFMTGNIGGLLFVLPSHMTFYFLVSVSFAVAVA